jgi:hypothetical protein
MLWQESVPKTNVEQTEGNGRSYLYLYPIGNLIQRNFQIGLCVCTNQRSFFRSFLTNNELRINYELMMMQAMMRATMLVQAMM